MGDSDITYIRLTKASSIWGHKDLFNGGGLRYERAYDQYPSLLIKTWTYIHAF
ncbi:hypothetical protein NTG1052_50128 [Candidatus Nitrotoga sp. 1052]|nr:hypothetical protein NTG1052_50128 [Candidatus Nitrotoga sp. 1052]